MQSKDTEPLYLREARQVAYAVWERCDLEHPKKINIQKTPVYNPRQTFMGRLSEILTKTTTTLVVFYIGRRFNIPAELIIVGGVIGAGVIQTIRYRNSFRS